MYNSYIIYIDCSNRKGFIVFRYHMLILPVFLLYLQTKCMEDNSKIIFLKLPSNMMQEISFYMNGKDYLQLGSTCKSIRHYLQCDAFSLDYIEKSVALAREGKKEEFEALINFSISPHLNIMPHLFKMTSYFKADLAKIEEFFKSQKETQKLSLIEMFAKDLSQQKVAKDVLVENILAIYGIKKDIVGYHSFIQGEKVGTTNDLGHIRKYMAFLIPLFYAQGLSRDFLTTEMTWNNSTLLTETIEQNEPYAFIIALKKLEINPNAIIKRYYSNSFDNSKFLTETPLKLAIDNCKAFKDEFHKKEKACFILKKLCQQSIVDVNFQFKLKQVSLSPLHYAISIQCDDAIKILLDHPKLNVNCIDSEKITSDDYFTKYYGDDEKNEIVKLFNDRKQQDKKQQAQTCAIMWD